MFLKIEIVDATGKKNFSPRLLGKKDRLPIYKHRYGPENVISRDTQWSAGRRRQLGTPDCIILLRWALAMISLEIN